MEKTITRITLTSDIPALVTEINKAQWDERNAMPEYSESALRAYLNKEDTLFIACHAHEDQRQQLLGIASARIEQKPYDHERWMYVDEVDVCADQRRQGAGTLLMQALIDLAEAEGCEELWLGADADNEAAQALYQSLDPDDVTSVVGFTYETDPD